MRRSIVLIFIVLILFPLVSHAAPSRACLKTATGKILIKRRCKAQKGEQEISAETLQSIGATQVGPAGPAGPKGEGGDPGSPDSPTDVLTKLKNADGSGSGLDADTLDGVEADDIQTQIDALQDETNILASQHLWATISFDGTLKRQSGLVSVTPITTGNRLLTFNRDVNTCAVTGSLHAITDGSIVVIPAGFYSGPSNNSEVQVLTYNQAGTLANYNFTVLVHCAN